MGIETPEGELSVYFRRFKPVSQSVNLIAIGERAGSGVPDIYSVWADKGWKDPEIEEQFDPDRTILTLAFTKKQAEKTSGKNKRKEQAGKTQASKTLANKEQIVSYIQKQNGAGTSEIADRIELSTARTRVLLAELISEGQIYAEGNGRARKYYVIE